MLLPEKRYFVRFVARAHTLAHTVTLYLSVRRNCEKAHLLLSTGVQCQRDKWDAHTQRIHGQPADNLALERWRSEVMQYINAETVLREPPSIDQIKKHLKHRHQPRSIGAAVELFLQTYGEHNRASTIRTTHSLLRTFIKTARLENTPLDISPSTLENRLTEAKKEYTGSSFGIIMSHLNNALRMAVREGLAENNPMDKINLKQLKRNPAGRKTREVPPYTELAERLKAAPPGKCYHIANIQLLTALSFADTVSLTIKNFVHDGNTLYIVGYRKKTDVHYLIPIKQEVFDLWNAYNYSNVNYEGYRQWIKKHLGVKPHDLRHAKARELLNLGLSLEAVSRVLGHASTQMTLNYAPIQGRKLLDREINLMLLR